MNFAGILARAEAGEDLSVPELTVLLAPPDSEAAAALTAAAHRVKTAVCGDSVHLRGLIEFSNLCNRDCFYCGIRRSMTTVRRYRMSADEIVRAATRAGEYGYGSVVLQSGERDDPEFTEFLTGVLRRIAALPYRLGITLSCGEQSRETYLRWREAGATRYLLRIESSNPALFARIHPAEWRWEDRAAALARLKEADYQVGTGVMIGLPGQTTADLAADVKFFQRIDADMIGMGPYLPQDDTPMGQRYPDAPGAAEARLELALRMISVTRLLLRDVNIAAATALQAISPADGRERGILAGANVIMPNVGDPAYRRGYQLYNGKPGLDENAAALRAALLANLAAIGARPDFNAPGDPLHYAVRTGKP